MVANLAQARHVLTAEMAEKKAAAESADPPQVPENYITEPWRMYTGTISCGAQGRSSAYTTDVATCLVNTALGVTCDQLNNFKKIDDVVGVTITAGVSPGSPITISGCKFNDGPWCATGGLTHNMCRRVPCCMVGRQAQCAESAVLSLVIRT